MFIFWLFLKESHRGYPIENVHFLGIFEEKSIGGTLSKMLNLDIFSKSHREYPIENVHFLTIFEEKSWIFFEGVLFDFFF